MRRGGHVLEDKRVVLDHLVLQGRIILEEVGAGVGRGVGGGDVVVGIVIDVEVVIEQDLRVGARGEHRGRASSGGRNDHY